MIYIEYSFPVKKDNSNNIDNIINIKICKDKIIAYLYDLFMILTLIVCFLLIALVLKK